MGSSFDIHKISHNLSLFDNVVVRGRENYTCLGVDLDQRLTWEKQMGKICSKFGTGIGVIKRMKPVFFCKNT